jgi:hypothetical protein
MERPFVRVLGGSGQFWLANHQSVLASWEYSQCCDAHFENSAKWFITVSPEGLHWYFFPLERIMGIFLVDLDFSCQKKTR